MKTGSAQNLSKGKGKQRARSLSQSQSGERGLSMDGSSRSSSKNGMAVFDFDHDGGHANVLEDAPNQDNDWDETEIDGNRYGARPEAYKLRPRSSGFIDYDKEHEEAFTNAPGQYSYENDEEILAHELEMDALMPAALSEAQEAQTRSSGRIIRVKELFFSDSSSSDESDEYAAGSSHQSVSAIKAGRIAKSHIKRTVPTKFVVKKSSAQANDPEYKMQASRHKAAIDSSHLQRQVQREGQNGKRRRTRYSERLDDDSNANEENDAHPAIGTSEHPRSRKQMAQKAGKAPDTFGRPNPSEREPGLIADQENEFGTPDGSYLPRDAERSERDDNDGVESSNAGSSNLSASKKRRGYHPTPEEKKAATEHRKIMFEPKPKPAAAKTAMRKKVPFRYAASTGYSMWSREEDECLFYALKNLENPLDPTRWKTILQLHGPNGKYTRILKNRTNVQLKDRART